MPNQRDVSFEDIPFYCKLLILAQLDTVDICNLSMVSRHWSRVCSDQLLWRELTHRDMSKWSFLGHKSNPLLPLGKVSENVQKKVYYDEKYLEISLDFHKRLCARHDLNFKALYFHCAYQQQQVKQMMGCAADSSSTGAEPSSTSSGHNISSGQSLPRFFRSLWTRFTSGHGKVIMLGPGMESSNTSKIFQHLLWERPDILTTVRLLPGTQDGVGSGVELDFKGEKRFSLIALYSGNRQARSQRAGMERLQQSNIIEETNEVPASDVAGSLVTSANPSVQRFRFKLRDAVYNFLSQKDISCYLIYVVDATVTPCVEQFACNRLEINAVLSGMNSYESGSSEYDNATSLDGATRESSAFSFGNFLGRTYSQNCTRNRTPLLVLCCTATSTSPRIPCIEVASLLDLASIVDRSWLVQDVAVDNLRGLEDGLVWLFKQSWLLRSFKQNFYVFCICLRLFCCLFAIFRCKAWKQ